jgi:hypothetical protein
MSMSFEQFMNQAQVKGPSRKVSKIHVKWCHCIGFAVWFDRHQPPFAIEIFKTFNLVLTYGFKLRSTQIQLLLKMDLLKRSVKFFDVESLQLQSFRQENTLFTTRVSQLEELILSKLPKPSTANKSMKKS